MESLVSDPKRARKRPPSKSEALRRANVLLEVSRRCAAVQTLDGVLEVLVEMTSRELDCDRGTLFLNDPDSSELYSRVAQGNLSHEIRVLNNTGIAGHVFQNDEPIIADDAYADERFNSGVDERTGYRTKTIICVPVKTLTGELIGVMQCLNKRNGFFTQEDLDILTEMTSQAAIALQSWQYVEQIERIRIKETAFLELVSEISAEFDLTNILQRVVAETTKMLNAERATIFLYDPATGTLFSRLLTGSDISEIRFPSHLGIAGAVFTSGESMNIPYAYADLRFNPAVDRQTGFFTRSILCVPILNKDNRVIGVTQMLNKKGGVFTDEDEQRLKAFTAQIAIALENSKLFDDVRRMKEYADNMLQSMSNGVITLDAKSTIVTCNTSGGRIWECAPESLVGKTLTDLLDDDSRWVTEKVEEVGSRRESETFPDATVSIAGVRKSVNLTIMPLRAEESAKEIGIMLMFDDISSEKRMMSTMSRYMDPVIAAQMLEGDATALLGGVSTEATIMFTDIRGFTPITEEYGAQGTVSFLNEYFSLMVECIHRRAAAIQRFQTGPHRRRTRRPDHHASAAGRQTVLAPEGRVEGSIPFRLSSGPVRRRQHVPRKIRSLLSGETRGNDHDREEGGQCGKRSSSRSILHAEVALSRVFNVRRDRSTVRKTGHDPDQFVLCHLVHRIVLVSGPPANMARLTRGTNEPFSGCRPSGRFAGDLPFPDRVSRNLCRLAATHPSGRRFTEHRVQ